MKIKVTTKNVIGAAVTKIKSSINEVQLASDLKKEIGDFAIDRIQKTTRSGKQMPDKKRFKSLSPWWIKVRKSLAKYNKTHDMFEDRFANDTLSGQVVDSLSYKKQGSEIIIEPTGTHKGYKLKPRQKPNKLTKKWTQSKPNKEVAKSLAEMGRGFVGLDDTSKLRIKRMIEKYMRKKLKLK
jgi:hypothetical protein